MANYTIKKYMGGTNDGTLEITDGDHAPTPWVGCASGEGPQKQSVYIYRGDKQDGNVTLRIYKHAGDVPHSELFDFGNGIINNPDS